MTIFHFRRSSLVRVDLKENLYMILGVQLELEQGLSYCF